jgi:hypothetical protein
VLLLLVVVVVVVVVLLLLLLLSNLLPTKARMDCVMTENFLHKKISTCSKEIRSF